MVEEYLFLNRRDIEYFFLVKVFLVSLSLGFGDRNDE